MSKFTPDPTAVQSFFGDIPNEQWRDIPEWEGVYQVSDFGRVRAMFANKQRVHGAFRIQAIDRMGRYRVTLWRHQKQYMYQVHCLVAFSFLGPRPDGYDVDHINQNCRDNRLVNLRYLPHMENISGIDNSGENNGRAKLTEALACEILHAWRMGKYKTKTEMALMYGVSRTTIDRVINGKRWKNLGCRDHDDNIGA